jgi:hypothetical protein
MGVGGRITILGNAPEVAVDRLVLAKIGAEMKLTQKKKCNGCKADSRDCELGYLRNSKEGIPAEPCPKPTTNDDYCEALAQWRKHQMD